MKHTLLFALAAAMVFMHLLARPATAVETAKPGASAVVIQLHGEIDDWRRDALFRHFAEARRLGAQTIIIDIDTFGGLVTSGLDISRFIKRQADVHTIALVHDKAISAGAMIAMACDEIVMERSSVIGDCAPIAYRTDGTLDALPPAERAKMESPVLADFRDSAARNHHDPLLAEAMVAVDRSVHCLRDANGQLHFVDNAGLKAATDQGWTAAAGIRDPLDTASELLTLPADVATTIGLSAATVDDAAALAKSRGLTIAATLSLNTGDWFVELLASPIARLLLIVTFALSLKTALAIPGHGTPEAIALLSIGLLLGMPMLTGYAQWWEIAMVVAGLALVSFEVFVLPGHFVSGVAGVVMMVAGLTLTFVGREPSGPGVLPILGSTYNALQTGLLVVTGGMFSSLLLWLWLNRFLPKIPYFNRLLLAPPGGDSTMMGALGADMVWPLVGTVGRAVTELKPGGSAQFLDEAINGERPISVVSDSGFVDPGVDVVVTESRGMRVVVRPL